MPNVLEKQNCKWQRQPLKHPVTGFTPQVNLTSNSGFFGPKMPHKESKPVAGRIGIGRYFAVQYPIYTAVALLLLRRSLFIGSVLFGANYGFLSHGLKYSHLQHELIEPDIPMEVFFISDLFSQSSNLKLDIKKYATK